MFRLSLCRAMGGESADLRFTQTALHCGNHSCAFSTKGPLLKLFEYGPLASHFVPFLSILMGSSGCTFVRIEFRMSFWLSTKRQNSSISYCKHF